MDISTILKKDFLIQQYQKLGVSKSTIIRWLSGNQFS